MPHSHDAVLVFVRAPVEGRVKMRLAAAIGSGAALRVYRRLAEHTIAECLSLPSDVAVRVHFTPTDAGEIMKEWLGDRPAYLPQPKGGLGERLSRAFGEAFTAGFSRVVVIGSDLPDFSAAYLRQAFAALDGSPAVIGPARDGGYWLLGLRAPLPGLFNDIPWSTGTVLERTMARLRSAGIEPAMLDELQDVDEVGDLPAGWAEWADLSIS